MVGSRVGWGLLWTFCASIAWAQTDPQQLRLEASSQEMRVDGVLNDWKGARFSELGSGDAASVRYALSEGKSGIYLGAEVRDDKLVSGERGDALVLTLALPEEKKMGLVVTTITLWPGEMGKRKAEGRVVCKGKTLKVPTLEVVDGPRKSGAGYIVEAFIPWSAIAGARSWEQARGSLRFVDVDGKHDEHTLATAIAKDSELPKLLLGAGQRDLLASFLQAQKLEAVEPRFDFRVNVSGDDRPERVVLIDRYVVVYGPGYARGDSFNYFALPYAAGGGLKNAFVQDLTGDGVSELVVVVHQPNAFGVRDAWLVLSLAEESMNQWFGVELRKETREGFVEDTVTLLKGPVPIIEQKVARAVGLDANSYREAPATDIAAILLPWGDVESRRFAWDGRSFSRKSETVRKDLKSAPGAQAAVNDEAAPIAVPIAASAAAGHDAVVAAFKEQQHLAADSKPTRSLRSNVLPGSTPEYVDLFGNMLVFSGPDVQQGQGFLSYALPLMAGSEITELSASDVTADGLDDLLLRLRQPLSGGLGVERELLLVLHADEQERFTRVLMVEVARHQGDRAIENQVIAQAGALVLDPGTARGWTQATYPFTSDAIAGATPLLLPWRDRPVRYHLQDNRLVPVR